jgi:ATP-dependent Clp protease protease subunit
LKLLAGGDTRAQAREHISQIKGKPDAALDPADKPDAVGLAWKALGDFRTDLRS